MPVFLLGLGLVGLLLWGRRAQAASPTAPQLPAGPAAYLPPIAAPEWARMAYAQAAASQNPIAMVQTAQLLMERGQVELARALSSQYQALTNQPIPGVGYYAGLPPGIAPLAGAPLPIGLTDPRLLRLLALRRLQRERRRQLAVAGLITTLRNARSA